MKNRKPLDMSNYLQGIVPGRRGRERKQPTGIDMRKYTEGLVPTKKVQPIEIPTTELPAQLPAEQPPVTEPTGLAAGPFTMGFGAPGAEGGVPVTPEPEPTRVETDVRRDAEQQGAEFTPVEGEILDNWSPQQHGVTVGARRGTPIHAVRAGVVEYSALSDIPGFGNLIIINHGDRTRSVYAYAEDRAVSAGERVERGQPIGKVGSTGALEQPALYFEEWAGQAPVLTSADRFKPKETPETGGDRLLLPQSLERRLEEKPGFMGRLAKTIEEAYPGAAKRIAESPTSGIAVMRAVEEAMRPLGREYTRPAAGWMQTKLRRAPSTEEIITMMRDVPRGKNITELSGLASEGLMPEMLDIPPDVLAGLRGVKAGHLLDPSASRVRSGREIGLIPEQFKADHPIFAVVPTLGQKALSEFFIKPYILYPEQAPTEATFDFLGGLLIGRGAKYARRSLGKLTKNTFLGIDVSDPLRNFLRRSDVTLNADTWRKFLDGSLKAGYLDDESAKALAHLSDDHLAQISEALADVGPGNPAVTLAVPREHAIKLVKPKLRKVVDRDIIDINLLNYDEVWGSNFARGVPDVLDPAGAEMAGLMEDVPRSVVAAFSGSRRGVGVTDEGVLRSFGVAVGKVQQAHALARRYGADAVADAIEEIGKRTAPGESALSIWTRETAREVAEEMAEAGQRGAVRIRRGVPAPPIEDEELRLALYGARTTRGRLNRFGGWLRAKGQEIKDLVTIEHEPQLVRAGEFQFRDDLRTQLMPVWTRAGEEVALQVDHNIFGALNKRESEQLLNILGMKSFLQSAGEGLDVPRKITQEVVERELEKQTRWAVTHAPKVIEAFGRYDDYARMVGEDLVRRGKLSPEDLKDFYFPHLVMDHLPEWWYRGPFAKKRLRDPFRPYTKSRIGSVKDIAISKQALMVHYSTVAADNRFDDAARMLLEKYDRLPGMNKATRELVFGKRGVPRPGRAYKVTVPGAKGEPVEQVMRGIQYQPGNVMYRTFAVDEKLLAQSLEDALLMPADEAERIAASGMDEILKFLEDVGPRGGNAIREVLAVGGYNKTYMVPEAIYNRMTKLRDPAMYIPGLYTLMGVTSFWKRFTLSPMGAGLPFHVANLLGDSEKLYLTAPGAMRDIPSALKIMWNMNPAKQRKIWGELSPLEEYASKIIHEKDVLGSGLMREYVQIAPGDPRQWMKLFERAGSMREAMLRVAMTVHQAKRHQAGKALLAPQFKHVLPNLDPESAIGFVGRGFATDYLAVPDFYRRYGRGLLVPFGTFWQRNLADHAAYVKNAPGWFTAKVVAPRVALWYHNNHGDPADPTSNRYVEERLPDWLRRRTHINFKAFDKDGDGIPDTAWTLAPELPVEMAGKFLGLDTIGEKLTLMRQGLITPAQAAKQMLWDVGAGPFRVGHDLMSPMIKVMEGWLTNRDPFTKQRIVPEGYENIPEVRARRYGEFMVGQLLTPVGNMIGARREGSPIDEVLSRKISLFRGMGLREVNLAAEEARDTIRIVRDTEAILARASWKLEQEYIKGDMEADEFFFSDTATRIQKDALAEGVFVTPVDVLEMLTSPTVRIDRLEVLKKREKDKAKYSELLREQNELLKMRAWDHAFGSPRAIRIKVLERIMEAQPHRTADDVFDYTGTPRQSPTLGTGQ